MPAPTTSSSPAPATAESPAAPLRREPLLLRLFARVDENLAEL